MRICAGVVLYEPKKERLKENISAIKNDVEHIFLVDNGSKNISEIKESFESEEKISFI